ncbi:hypothetical protein F52700_7684 [Fusarium sp. NRRL 52700]|nr:hypothetical protein F52700_7684 [Fusarium sp. NRRL 52700]
MRLENERKRIENERTGLVWEGLQSRGPANRQRPRELTRPRILDAPRSGEAISAGSFRANDSVSLPPAHEPAPGPSTIPGPLTIIGPLTVLGTLTVLGHSTTPGPSTAPGPPPPGPLLSPGPPPAPAPLVHPPLPTPVPTDRRPIPSGQDIRRAWEEGRYIDLGPRRTVVKNASTQTEPTDLGTETKPLELPPRTYVSRAVQTDPAESPVQEEPEAPVVVPELSVSEPSPDPASSEDTDTQTSLNKGKALEGPEPTINANLVIKHENRAEDKAKEPEYSAVSSPLPASITLPGSPESITEAEPEVVQTHATGLDRQPVIHSSVTAFMRSTRLPAVHSRMSAAETSRRRQPGPKSSLGGTKSKGYKGISHQSRRDVPTRTDGQTKRYQDKQEKMDEMSMELLSGQTPSSFKSLETQKVIDSDTTPTSVPNHSTPVSHDDSKHDIQGGPVVGHPLTSEIPLPKTPEPQATPENRSVSNVLTTDPVCIALGTREDQSEVSLQTLAESFPSTVSAENEPFTGSQSTTACQNTERSQQALTEALIKACEQSEKETSLLKASEDGTTLAPDSTPILSNTLNHSVSKRTSIGQLPSAPGTSSIPMLQEIKDTDIALDQIIASSALRGSNESDEDIYEDSLGGHDVVANQQESLIGGPETSDEEMGDSEPAVSTLEKQTPASPMDDAQMTDVWRPNEEESMRIGDVAQDVFKFLIDSDDEDSSEDAEPEDADMQDTQSFALHATPTFTFQLPELPTIEIGLTRQEEKLAEDLVDALMKDREDSAEDTRSQDSQPLFALPQSPITLLQPLTTPPQPLFSLPQSPITPPQPPKSPERLLEDFRARVKAAEAEPQTDKDKSYAQKTTDNDIPDPVKEATAEQRATRRIAKPASRAHMNTSTAHTLPETLQQASSEDSRVDMAEMDLAAARNLLSLSATGRNDASNQAASPSGNASSREDTDAQSTNSQKANTQETNAQESSIGDNAAERPTATTLPEEPPEPNSQQPQSASASILPAESQHSLVQPTPTQTPPAQPSPLAASTAAAQQNTPTTRRSPTVAGPNNTQQQPYIPPRFQGGLAFPGGNPTLYNPAATATPAPKKTGSSTQGRSPSLKATGEGAENKKAEMDVIFGTPGSHKKKQGLQIVDIRDLPDNLKAQIREHDAKDA